MKTINVLAKPEDTVWIFTMGGPQEVTVESIEIMPEGDTKYHLRGKNDTFKRSSDDIFLTKEDMINYIKTL